ncbi:MAG: hypothetical protein OHK0038_12150 [Flammeovirgaceae bacterium]
MFACEELVNPTLKTIEPIVVVEALVTNREGDSFVKLTKTTPYNSSEETPKISGAIISLKDDASNQWNFSEVEKGLYLPPSGFKGEIGRTYEIKIMADNQVITAKNYLPNISNIDSLKIEKRDFELPLEDGFYMVAYFQEPENEKNYYMWKILKNNEFIEKDKIFLLDDDEINGQQLAYIFYEQTINPIDTLGMEFYSLSKPSFNYYQVLKELVEQGSPSQSVPENPVSNLKGNAIGFFNTSAVFRLNARR